MKKIIVTTIIAPVFLMLLAFLLAGCRPIHLTSLSSIHGASGEVFTIHGTNFGGTQGSRTPSINRCRAYPLVVLSWASTEVQVRIPPDLPSGNYKVLIYFDSSYRTSSNSLDFWVDAASVPAEITNPYERQVRSFKLRYGKSDEWETWMLDNRIRYEGAFSSVQSIPCTLNIAFRYDAHPIAYDPPWASEAQHMAALKAAAELCYIGYDFRFIFEGDTSSSYGNLIAGIPTNESYATGKNVYTYYETIFYHEFAHIIGLWHHYDTDADMYRGTHMPPGEHYCLMDRNAHQFCSACRTALNIPLDVDNEEALFEALMEIRRRYIY